MGFFRRNIKIIIALSAFSLFAILILSFVISKFGGQYAAERIVLPKIEDKLGTKLSWKRVNASFGEISIEGLELRWPQDPNLPSTKTLIKKVEVHYEILPLLIGRIEIDKVSFKQPHFLANEVNSDLINAIQEKLSEFSSNQTTSQSSGTSHAPNIEVEGASFLVDRFKGYKIKASEIDGFLESDGDFETYWGKLEVFVSDRQSSVLDLGPLSVEGNRLSGNSILISKADIDGGVIRNQINREIIGGLVKGQNNKNGESASGAQKNLFNKIVQHIQLPETIGIKGLRTEIVWEGEKQKREVNCVDLEGRVVFGSDEISPGLELIGTMDPGGGQVGVSAKIGEEARPRARVQLSEINIGQLASGLSLSGFQFDENSVIDADFTVGLTPQNNLRFKGKVSANKLTFEGRIVAPEKIEELNFRSVGTGEFNLEDNSLVVEESHFWINDIETKLSGHWTRGQEHTDLELISELYPIHCADLYESVPEVFREHLSGLSFEGMISGRFRVAVNTENLEETALEVDLNNGCRATGSGPLDIERLEGSFLHTVHLPDDEVFEFRTGPGSGSWASFSEISPYMIAAVLATEDGRFFRHKGFSLREIRRALIRDIEAGRPRFGASTISMQLARNLYLFRQRTLARKFQEAILTWYIEENLSKEQMMAYYLNIIEYGPRIFGIRHAATHYFGRQTHDLSPREAVFLAKLLPAPVRRYEQTYEEGSLSPRWQGMLDRVLRVMHDRGYLTQDELRRSLEDRIVFHNPENPLPPYRHWPDRSHLFHRRDRVRDDELPPARWLEIDMDAHIPAPPNLEDQFE